MKKVIVIGAGISGLISAVYARRSGFETLVLEKAANPGGVSTSWRRKGYLFEGSIHWLIGSSPKNPLHDIWTETGALQANNPVFAKDPVYTLVDASGVRKEALYRDLRKLGNDPGLRSMRFHVACFRHFHTPIQDIPWLKCRYPRGFNPWEYIKMLPAVLITPYLMSISTRDYLKRVKDKYLRDLLSAVVDPGINALSLIYTLSTFAAEGDSGYPAGGSLRMAQNMADTLISMGGEILYRTPAEQIIAQPDGTYQVQTAGETFQADAVIITMDARRAMDKLFPEPLQERWARKMRKELITEHCMFLGIGVKADLSAYPRSMQVVLDPPLETAGRKYRLLIVNNYAQEKDYAPEGCSVITTLLSGESYKFWKAAKEDGSYKEKKEEVIRAFLERIVQYIPEIEGNVEVTDLATPLTYERYCDTFEGSYMTHWLPKRDFLTAPIHYKKGLYFAGQRTAYSGGLPPAATSARTAAQFLCRDFNVEFVSK